MKFGGREAELGFIFPNFIDKLVQFRARNDRFCFYLFSFIFCSSRSFSRLSRLGIFHSLNENKIHSHAINFPEIRDFCANLKHKIK